MSSETFAPKAQTAHFDLEHIGKDKLVNMKEVLKKSFGEKQKIMVEVFNSLKKGTTFQIIEQNIHNEDSTDVILRQANGSGGGSKGIRLPHGTDVTLVSTPNRENNNGYSFKTMKDGNGQERIYVQVNAGGKEGYVAIEHVGIKSAPPVLPTVAPGENPVGGQPTVGPGGTPPEGGQPTVGPGENPPTGGAPTVAPGEKPPTGGTPTVGPGKNSVGGQPTVAPGENPVGGQPTVGPGKNSVGGQPTVGPGENPPTEGAPTVGPNTPISERIPSNEPDPTVYAAFVDSTSPKIDSDGLKQETIVDMKSEVEEVVNQLKDSNNRALAKPKFEMASRIVEAYIGAMQKRAPGLEGKRQGAGIMNGAEGNPLLTDDMQKGYFSGETLRTILGEIEAGLGKKDPSNKRYDTLFQRMQECETHYADVIDKGDLADVQKNMGAISEDGTAVNTQVSLNIWDQFRGEYIGDDGSSEDARSNIGRMVYEKEEASENQDLKDFRNALKKESETLKNSANPNPMLTLGNLDGICKRYKINLTDTDRSKAQKILSDISVAFEGQKSAIRDTIARDFLNIAPGAVPTPEQNKLIDSILPKVQGYMLAEGLEAAIYPILFYRLHQTDSTWYTAGLGNKFDSNKSLNKLSWANWDEASKIGQRIGVELAAFAAGGWAVNALRGAAIAGRIAMTAGRLTEAGRAAQSLATAPRWVQGLSSVIHGAAVGAVGSMAASGVREGMHEGVAHYGQDAAFGALYGAMFPMISTQIGRLGEYGSQRIGSMTPDMIKNISARIGLSAARDGSRNLLNRVLVNPALILGRETLQAGTTLGVVEAGQKMLTDSERDFALAQLVKEAWDVITTDTSLAEGLRDMRLEEILPLIATNIMIKRYKQPEIVKPEPKPIEPVRNSKKNWTPEKLLAEKQRLQTLLANREKSLIDQKVPPEKRASDPEYVQLRNEVEYMRQEQMRMAKDEGKQDFMPLKDEFKTGYKDGSNEFIKTEPIKKVEPPRSQIETELDYGRMKALEQQIRNPKSDIEKAGNPGTENANTRKQVELNDQKNTFINELNSLRAKYKVRDYSRAPDLASNLTANEFVDGVTTPRATGRKQESAPSRTTTEKLPPNPLETAKVGDTIVSKSGTRRTILEVQEGGTIRVTTSKEFRGGTAVDYNFSKEPNGIGLKLGELGGNFKKGDTIYSGEKGMKVEEILLGLSGKTYGVRTKYEETISRDRVDVTQIDFIIPGIPGSPQAPKTPELQSAEALAKVVRER